MFNLSYEETANACRQLNQRLRGHEGGLLPKLITANPNKKVRIIPAVMRKNYLLQPFLIGLFGLIALRLLIWIRYDR